MCRFTFRNFKTVVSAFVPHASNKNLCLGRFIRLGNQMTQEYIPETIPEKIERFDRYVKELISVAINEINLQHEKHHAKLLLVCILDLLSKSYSPNINRNRKRFVTLINDCSSWKEKNYFNLLHLSHFFSQEHIRQQYPETSEVLLQKTKVNLPTTQNKLRTLIHLEVDISKDEMDTLWVKDSNNQFISIDELLPFKFENINLLWVYRNVLVHEYRSPGTNVEFNNINETEPYYCEISRVTNFNESGFDFINHWELVFPIGFFKRLCFETLENVCNFHRENNTSPFTSYSSGTYWIKALNEY